jgi:membrane protease YdiL (CAAX protease family)
MTGAGELAVFYGLVFLTIWGGQWIGVRPPGLVAAALIAAFCAWSARRNGEGRERLGFDRRWLGPSARKTALWAGPFLLVLVVKAAWPPWPTPERLLYGAKGVPGALSGWPWPAVLALGLLRYPLWSSVQEYALLSFSANRVRSLVPNPWAAAFLNGALFCLAHAPNPILMTATFIAGVVFTRIFFDAPHVVPPALAHALAGLCLSVIFRDFYPAMMVGPAYFQYSAAGG